MRILLLTTLLLIIVSASGFAQYRNFVELRDSTIIRGKVELSQKMFKKTRLIVNDTTEIPLYKVRAYQISDGYFLRMNQGYGDDFAKRIEEGNIDLYTRVQTHMSTPSYMPGPMGTSTFVGGGFSQTNVEYFSKNGEKLQKANARNLKKALFDNPESMRLLQKRDNLTVVQVLGIIGGATLAIGSVVAQKDKEDINLSGFVIGGMIMSGSSWIPHFQKKELTQEAIEVYNNPGVY